MKNEKVIKKTIWYENNSHPDTYGEFLSDFKCSGNGKVYVTIACSGHYAIYVNGKLAKMASSADYPWYRTYDKVNITRFCEEENQMVILVWYPGVDSQTYIKDKAGLMFVVEENGVVLDESGRHTKSRQNINYKNGYCKLITSQLGFSFYYDNTIENKLEYLDSVEREETVVFNLRKTANLLIAKRVKTSIQEIENGYLVDFGEEQVGILDLEFISLEKQYIKILYAEHLVNDRVQSIIDGRDFSVEFYAKEGKNSYVNPFRRLAGRYIQIVCEKPITIKYIGLRSTDRKVIKVHRKFDDAFVQRIYDVSVNTLTKCMHEHYEDCPWREQAMYALDSRNQMLCGYYAFKGYQYQRENLLFMAKGQREDGLLSLCFPAGIDIPIPFFSLAYFMQVNDYVKHTGDRSVLDILKPTLDKILYTFSSRIDKTGLIPHLEYPFWNFYEWADESNNENEITRLPDEPNPQRYDLIINCMYAYVSGIYDGLYGTKSNMDSLINAICNTFYNSENGMYKLHTDTDRSSQLGNSMVMLIGLGNEKLADQTINDKSLIKVTLSMNTFYYDALLMFGDKHRDFILNDIKKKYGYMLEQGATTFWETEKDWQDFNNAGSLCHGWSAIPVYYLNILDE